MGNFFMKFELYISYITCLLEMFNVFKSQKCLQHMSDRQANFNMPFCGNQCHLVITESKVTGALYPRFQELRILFYFPCVFSKISRNNI